jgi:hypothetical protein
MSTDQPLPFADHTSEEGPAPERQPDWWHRDHPTFTALAGFFTGLVTVVLVPGFFAGVLHTVFSTTTVERLFPFVLVLLAVPLALTVSGRTRRFGLYMLLGMVLTAVVVLGVAGVVLWYLINHDG